MDLGTFITGGIFVSLGALPFIVVGKNRRSKKKKKQEELNLQASAYEMSVSDSEVSQNYALAYDGIKKTLLFKMTPKEEGSETEFDYIELKKLKAIQLMMDRNTRGNSEIKRLYLRCFPKEQGAKLKDLVFYNVETDFQLVDELQESKKWEKFFNDELKSI